MKKALRVNRKLMKTEGGFECLRILIQSDRNFKNHVSYVYEKVCKLMGFVRHCKYTLTSDFKLQFHNYYIKPIFKYGSLVYGLTSESRLKPILILQRKSLQTLENLPFRASCTHLFTESGFYTFYAMYAGALLKYLLFNSQNFVEKCMSSSDNMKTRRQQKALLHYGRNSKLTENSFQYKEVKLYNMFKEIGLWPVGQIMSKIKCFIGFTETF